jgi:hypothetical protein
MKAEELGVRVGASFPGPCLDPAVLAPHRSGPIWRG